MKKILTYFSRFEAIMLASSIALITLFFLIFDRQNYMTLTASLIGVISLMLNAKGNPAGQLLMMIFSLLYGIISYSFSYYGEMITYLGMTAPMALFALISWLRHPYEGKRSQVEVNRLKAPELIFAALLTAAVTAVFYFILKALGTTNLFFSTVSVTTSFIAVYLTFRRSALYAIGYAANDLVLIILWTMAATTNRSYVSVVVCFAVFFVSDLYGFISWQRMARAQVGHAGKKHAYIKPDVRDKKII